jgi:hypothetical protein
VPNKHFRQKPCQTRRHTILIQPCQACCQLESGQQRGSSPVSPLSGIIAFLFYTPDTVVDLCAYFCAVSYQPGLALPGNCLLGRAAGDTGLYHRASPPARSYKQRQTRSSWADSPVSWSSRTGVAQDRLWLGLAQFPRLSDLSRLASITLSAAVWSPASHSRLPACVWTISKAFLHLTCPCAPPSLGLPLSALYP